MLGVGTYYAEGIGSASQHVVIGEFSCGMTDLLINRKRKMRNETSLRTPTARSEAFRVTENSNGKDPVFLAWLCCRIFTMRISENAKADSFIIARYTELLEYRFSLGHFENLFCTVNPTA